MNRTRRLTYTAAFTALGIIIPSIFHATGVPGQMFLPMHIPVLLCGMICGPFFGGISAVITVLLSSAITGMPPLYPTGLLMIFELIGYAVVSGFLIKAIKIKPLLLKLYIVLISAMIIGRGVYGLAAFIVLGIIGNGYAFTTFITAAFVTSFPGIIIQLALVPALVILLNKVRLIELSDIHS